MLQITGAAHIPLAQADFILNPMSVVPVAVDLMRPDRVGLGKFVEPGATGGLMKAGKGITKAGVAGKLAYNSAIRASWPVCKASPKLMLQASPTKIAA